MSMRQGGRVPALAALLWLLHAAAAAQGWERGDVVIVDNPRAFRLYNEFQQPVGDPSAAGIAPLAPIVVLSPAAFLGDGLTPCMTVRINGRQFYLIKDPETLEVIGARSAGAVTVIKRARAVRDTLAILANGAVVLEHPGTGAAQPLPAGARIERLFTADGRAYARLFGVPETFGWVSLDGKNEGVVWERVRAAEERLPSAPPRTFEAVNGQLSAANRVIASVYAALGDRGGRPLPSWSSRATDSTIVCLLDPLPAEGADESTRLLARSIENALLGEGNRVIWTPGRIEIRR